MTTRVQVSKASVRYRTTGDLAVRCATCVMFHPDGTCDLVKGRIDPDGTCDRWYPRVKVPPLADAAAEAYLSGWALTDAPWTGRADAGLIAAVELALEHRDDPAVLETSLLLGSLEGVWQTVYDRRAKLQARHERKVLAAWRALVKTLNPGDVVAVFRRETYQTAEAATKDPTRRWWQDAGAAAALGWLRRLYHADGYDALVTALADAIRAGMAEGEAGALALAASRQGKTGFAIDRAFKAAYTRLAADNAITQRAADAATRLIDATAGDVGRRLAALAGDGSSEDDMTSGVEDVLDGQQAPTTSTDWAVWAAVLAGAVGLYSWLSGDASSLPGGGPDMPAPPAPPPDAGPVLLDWITAGDGRVCAVCDGYQASGPYAPGAVPDYPHPRCRCSVDLAANYGSSSFLLALLDSYSN